MDPQLELQKMKLHPFINKIVEGGKVVQYGAKTIPEGGYFAMPRLYADGLLLAGDCGGFLNGQRLKGVHLAIASGMQAADVLLEALVKKDSSSAVLSRYETTFQKSKIGKELWGVRNFHQSFKPGLFVALVTVALKLLFGGRLFKPRLPSELDAYTYKKLDVDAKRTADAEVPYDGKLFLNKLSDVYLAGSKGQEDQPSHLQVANTDVCATKCLEEYGAPCTNVCPAQVYELAEPLMARAELASCVNDPATRAKLDDDIAWATEHDIHGTPLVLMNGKPIAVFGPLLYALILTGGDSSHPVFANLPEPKAVKPHDHQH